MSIPREVAEAAEEIRAFEKNANPDSIKGLDLGATSKHVHIDHAGLANSLVKFISFVRMPDKCKEVMLYKLANPGTTNFQVAMVMGLRLFDVDLYEEEGKKRVANALASTSLQDAINKFNRERTVENAMKEIDATLIPGGSNKLS